MSKEFSAKGLILKSRKRYFVNVGRWKKKYEHIKKAYKRLQSFILLLVSEVRL
jgi:hypothetical protein